MIFPNEVLTVKKPTGQPGLTIKDLGGGIGPTNEQLQTSGMGSLVGGQNAPGGQPEPTTGLPQAPATTETKNIQADIDTATTETDFVDSVQKILDAYGVKKPDSTKSPLENVMDIYKQLDEVYGISSAKKEYEKLSNDMAEEIAKANENPFVSELTRQKMVNKIQDKYETKLKTQLALFEKNQHLAEFLIGKAISISDDQQDYNKDVIFKAISLAQSEQEATRKEKKEEFEKGLDISKLGLEERRVRIAETREGRLGEGGGVKFSNTQITKGAANAGISIANFKTLDTDTQNFFINRTNEINTKKKEIDNAKVQGEDPRELERDISESNAPPEVKDLLVRYLKEIFKDKYAKFGQQNQSKPWWQRIL